MNAVHPLPDAGRVENAGIKRAIRINAGRNGSYLVEMDNKALLTHVDINNVVCAMPAHTRLYEGLASGFIAGWHPLLCTWRGYSRGVSAMRV